MKKLLVVLLILGLAAPAMAGDWHFYGSARMMLGYATVDKDFAPAFAMPSLDPTIRPWTASGLPAGSRAQDDAGLFLSQSDGQARFGAYAKASDTVSGQYEIGYNASNFKTRLLYGQWKFGAGNLRVGQDYTPATFLLYSNMTGDMAFGGDEIMLTTAIPYISRRPQLKLTFGGFQVALIEHNTAAPGLSAVSYKAPDVTHPITDNNGVTFNVTETGATTRVVPGYDSDLDYSLPRIELAYQFNTPMVSLRPILGYQTYDAKNTLDNSKSITSYLLGLGVKLRFGPAYVNVSGAYAVNAGNYGLLMPLRNEVKYAALDAAGDVQDATTLQGLLVAGFKINPMVGLEAGVGYMHGENKAATAVSPTTVLNVDLEQSAAMLYYLQASIALAPGVTIVPEIGSINLDELTVKVAGTETKTDLGSYTYGMVKFQIDF